MNPFLLDSTYPSTTYLVWLLASYVISIIIPHIFRLTGNSKTSQELELHPYEVAYLRGGADHVLLTAYANLMQNHIIGLVTDNGNVKIRLLAESTKDLVKLHRQMVMHESMQEIDDASKDLEESISKSTNGLTWEEAQKELGSYLDHIDTIKKRVVENGLVMSSTAKLLGRLSGLACLLIPPIFLGIPKILESLAIHNPNYLLILLVGISFFLVYKSLGTKQIRSFGGQRKFNQILNKNWGLYEASSQDDSNLTRVDWLLSFCIFGLDLNSRLTRVVEMYCHNSAFLKDPDFEVRKINAWMEADSRRYGIGGCSCYANCGVGGSSATGSTGCNGCGSW